MEKGKCRLRSLQFLAIAVSFLMAIVVFPPSYFLGGNAVYAEPVPDEEGTSSPPSTTTTPDFTTCTNSLCGGTIPGNICSTNEDCGSSTQKPATAVRDKEKQKVDPELAVLAVAAAATTLVAAFTFTLPATTKIADWIDPRGIDKVPVRKNPYLCEKPGNYTLSAKMDTTNAISFESGKPLYTSGSRVTVFGEVEALSATCSGLELECSEQKAQACKINKRFMGYDLEYQNCPNGFTQLHAEGERSETSVLGIVLLVIAVIASIFTAGASLGAFGAAIGGLTAAQAAAIATMVATAASTGSKIASDNVANSVDDHPCFSVCGKDYKSQDPSSPFCHKGGPVLGYKVVEYSCNQASCGPARSKKVSIDVKSGEGSRIQRADTSTDGVGSFSYTFNAPPQDGDFFVFVKVTK